MRPFRNTNNWVWRTTLFLTRVGTFLEVSHLWRLPSSQTRYSITFKFKNSSLRHPTAAERAAFRLDLWHWHFRAHKHWGNANTFRFSKSNCVFALALAIFFYTKILSFFAVANFPKSSVIFFLCLIVAQVGKRTVFSRRMYQFLAVLKILIAHKYRNTTIWPLDTSKCDLESARLRSPTHQKKQSTNSKRAEPRPGKALFYIFMSTVTGKAKPEWHNRLTRKIPQQSAECTPHNAPRHAETNSHVRIIERWATCRNEWI